MLSNKEFDPTNSCRFYCNNCDMHVVDSTNKDTGKFFTQFGHMYDKETKTYDGEYVGVMFAVCAHCLGD